MSELLDARYLNQDGVAVMVIAAFCLGLILGAVLMDTDWDRVFSRPERPVRAPKRAPRHRATPGSPPRGQGGVSGGGHPVSHNRIDVRA